MIHTELSLNAYIEQHLGHTPQEQLINFLAKPFGAVSFAEFWVSANKSWDKFSI